MTDRDSRKSHPTSMIEITKSRSSEEWFPNRDSVKSFRDEPLREGDYAVECSNPGHFLRVHPNAFGQMANHPAYSYFRKKS